MLTVVVEMQTRRRGCWMDKVEVQYRQAGARQVVRRQQISNLTFVLRMCCWPQSRTGRPDVRCMESLQERHVANRVPMRIARTVLALTEVG